MRLGKRWLCLNRIQYIIIIYVVIYAANDNDGDNADCDLQ